MPGHEWMGHKGPVLQHVSRTWAYNALRADSSRRRVARTGYRGHRKFALWRPEMDDRYYLLTELVKERRIDFIRLHRQQAKFKVLKHVDQLLPVY